MKQQDERIFTGLSHLSIIVPWWGIIAAIVIWATQKDKSELVRFQALQAVCYHILRIALQFVLFLAFPISLFCILLVLVFIHGGREPNEPPMAMIIPFGILIFAFMMDVALLLYGVYGAYRAYQGADFRYALVGRRVHKHLYEQAEG